MGKKSKVTLTVIVVLAIVMIVTGVVGATTTFPGPAERVAAYPFEQQKTVPGGSFDSVKIDGRTVDLQLSSAAIDEAQIRLKGQLFRKDQNSGDFIETNVRNGELRISFSKKMLMTELQLFGIEVGGEETYELRAELVLPQKLYRSIKIDSVSGDVLVRGVESRMLDVESELGDIVFETTQQQEEQLSLKAESEHGSITIFGEPVRATRDGHDEDDDFYEYDDRHEHSYRYFIDNGENWVELESEHGSIAVKELK
jgi:lia operon protein LiaG